MTMAAPQHVNQRSLADQIFTLCGLIATAQCDLEQVTGDGLPDSVGVRQREKLGKVRQTLDLCKVLGYDCLDSYDYLDFVEMPEAAQPAPSQKLVARDTFQQETNDLAALAQALFEQVANNGPSAYALAKTVFEQATALGDSMDVMAGE